MGKKIFTCGLSATSNIYSPRWARNPFTCGNIHSPRWAKKTFTCGLSANKYSPRWAKKHLPVVYQLIYILLDGENTFTCGLSANIHSLRWGKNIYLWFIN
jgi:hypothetical protein